MNDVAVQVGKYCSACGNALHQRAEICPKCGVRQVGAASGRNRTTALVLAFFLGGLGAHKFYLGQTVQGVVYLLFCWTFIPALIAFVEFIIFLTMSDEKFAEKYAS